MMTVATISGDAPIAYVEYLTQQVSPSSANDMAVYYAQGALSWVAIEVRQDMHPVVARALGIDSRRPMTNEELTNLLAGRRSDGAQIKGRSERSSNGHKARVTAYDFTFSADKSMSLAWALAKTDAERAVLLQAHRSAVEAASAHVANRLGWARRGDGGRYGADRGHVAYVTLDHATARPTLALAVTQADGRVATEMVPVRVGSEIPGDPQLHTHVVMFNVVVTDDGHVGSLDSNRLYGFVKEAGAYYQAELAQNLRRIGADVILDEQSGAARLAAIPDEVRDFYSKRTKDAETDARAYAKAQGLEWGRLSGDEQAKLLKQGSYETRRNSTGGAPDFQAWEAQAAAIGWQHDGAVGKVTHEPLTHDQRMDIAYTAALPFLEAEFTRRAVIDIGDVRVAATRGLIAAGPDSPADIDSVVDLFRQRGVRQDGRMVILLSGEEGGVERFTTNLHIHREGMLVRLAKSAAMDRGSALTQEDISRAIARSGLNFTNAHGRSQLGAIEALGMGGAIGVAIGVAGSGKTALLGTLTDAHHARDDRVYGVSLAWRQADDLAAAGIADNRRFAVSVFLDAVREGDIKPDRSTVIMLDEMYLVGTKQFTELLEIRERTGMRLYGVGDNMQGQSIDAGALDPLLRRALVEGGLSEVAFTVRQRTARERQIAGLFRAGKAGEALALKREDGSAELVPGGPRAAAQRAAQLYMERKAAHADHSLANVSISAPTNADTRMIGTEIRLLRRAAGEIGGDARVLEAIDQTGEHYRLPIAVGDQVRLFASVMAIGEDGRRFAVGRNGSTVDVLGFTQDSILLQNKDGRSGVVRLNKLADKETGRIRLTYGYALTTSAAQSLTSTEHIDAMPNGTRGVNGFCAYVAESRHRRRSWTIISDGAERREIHEGRPRGDSRPITEEDVWENAARNLSRQPQKESALDFMRRCRKQSRQEVESFQMSRFNLDKGQHVPLHERTEQAREEREVLPVLQAVAKSFEAARYRHRVNISEHDAAQSFADVLAIAGFDIGKIGLPLLDGQAHYAPRIGDRGREKSGSYIGFYDDHPAGKWVNLKTGEKGTWRSGGDLAEIDPAEAERAARQRAAVAEHRQREHARRRAHGTRDAARRWEAGKPASSAHPYLQAKNISAEGLRQDADGRLLVPLIIGSSLVNLQTIDADGQKRFITDAPKKGAHFVIGELIDGQPIAIAEGLATARDAALISRAPTVMALDTSNLLPVAEALRASYPNSQLIFMADNDAHLPRRKDDRCMPNTGIEKAEKAAAAVGNAIVLAAPELPERTLDDKGTDWQDYRQAKGLSAARAAGRDLLVQAQAASYWKRMAEKAPAKEQGQAQSQGVSPSM